MYYLSLLSTFKNETVNLKLWIEHYLWQGVEHFYLIDNNSDDNPLSILQDYIDKGIVTYYFLPEKFKQVQHYQHVFNNEKLKEKTIWLAVCDLDEYFFGTYKKLVTEIKNAEPNYDYILCNWKMFGSGGHKVQPIDIRTAITHCCKDLWKETKYIFKTSVINDGFSLWIHYLINVDFKKIRMCTDNVLIKLNHYVIQSLEFFQKVKMTRGGADCLAHDNIRNMSYFERYDFHDCEDLTLKNILLNLPTDY